jgi:hypothetical protein
MRIGEKCPECNSIEPIGRIVCQTKLAEAHAKRDFFVEEKISTERKSLFSFLGLSCFCICMVTLAMAPSSPHTTKVILLFGFLSIVFHTLSVRRGKKWKHKKEFEVKKRFAEKYPDHADIIRKAEGVKSGK